MRSHLNQKQDPGCITALGWGTWRLPKDSRDGHVICGKGDRREARPTLRHGFAESRSTGIQAVGGGSSHNDRPAEVS